MAKPSTKSPKRRKPPAGNERASVNVVGNVKAADIRGLKYFQTLAPLLAGLHNHQCRRDRAGNRTLHYDQYVMLVLLYVFNPTVSSLGALAQASELTKVQKKLGNAKATKAAMSEASRLFDADLLKGVIAQLAGQTKNLPKDPRLGDWYDKLTAVDGSIVSALPSMLAASVLKQTTGTGLVQWRLHTHFEVSNLLPARIDVTPNGGGDFDERAVMAKAIGADRLYVMDRGYAKFGLFNAIVAGKSSYLCRLRDNTVAEVVDDRPLSDGDRAAGVVSDAIVKMGGTNKNRVSPDHPFRIVQVRCTPHQNRTGGKAKGSTAPGSDGILRIATNLLDVPAEIIALMYSYRWAVEIFFRFYKQLCGGSHLISHSANGIEIQAYCSMIACLLINLWTGQRPNKRTFEMISYYFQGLASEEELIAHIEKVRLAAERKAAKEAAAQEAAAKTA